MKKLLFTLFFIGSVTNINAQVPSYLPTNGLVGYWPFNGNANDESSIGNNGIVYGATLTTDKDGNMNSAFSFDGVDDYIELNNSFFGGSNSVGSFTIYTLVKVNSYDVGRIFGKEGYWRTISLSNTTVNDKNVFWFGGSQPSPQQYFNIYSNSEIELNKWYNLIITFNDGELKIYINGVLDNSNTISLKTLDWSFLTSGNSTSTNHFGRVLPKSGNHNYFSGEIDDFGIWNRVLTEQEIANLYSSNSSNTQKPTWKLLSSDSELPKTNLKFLPYGFDKGNRLIYLLNVKENWLYSYNIDNNTFNLIQVNNYPNFDRHGDFLFNPSSQTIQFWRSGTDKVYEVSRNGGNITQIGNGSYNSQLYGSDAIYNGVTTNPALMNGYGWVTHKNAAYELLEGVWVQTRDNSDNQPFKRGTTIYPNEDFTKAYIIDGQGNASGNQTESSCSIAGALPWATDVGKYCWLRDLWEIDLSDWSIRSILPLNSNFTSTGSFGFDYKNKTFYSFGGFTPPSNYGQELQWSNTLRVFNLNSQSGWVDLEQYGDIPPTGESYVSYFDEELNRFIVCSNKGIWALNLEENSGSLSTKVFALQDQVAIYPNPTNNTLFISGNKTPIEVTVFNLLGKEVLTVRNTNKINVQALLNGMYIVRISDGIHYTTKKFIKN